MAEVGKQHDVPIHIDGTMHKVSSSITGSELYQAGKVGADYDLFLEAQGKGDDTLIKNDATPYKVEPGDHFYTAPKSLNPGR
jgi:hypothetical protein